MGCNEIIVEVTQSEFEAELARGLQEDEIMHPGRHVFRRGGFLTRHGISSALTTPAGKINVSLYFDSDVVSYFQMRTNHLDATSLQVQINQAFREMMERDLATIAIN